MRVNQCEHALDLWLLSAPNCTLTFHFDRIWPDSSRTAGARWVAC
ncbi:MAG TPA: hypothetical protein VFL61_12240 [Gaiellaceae bacterium]|nr:hypothetical protein [Gaiellaceae bacterium]